MNRFQAAALGLLSSVVLGAGQLAAQIPDNFQNLKVLPKDIKKADLVETMKAFAKATGLRCDGCHQGKGTGKLEDIDFASDAKDEKRTTRAMMAMVRKINDESLAKLEHRAKVPVNVTCATCHHGRNRPPQALDAMLTGIVVKDGTDAAVKKYQELRAEFYGGDAYDFRENTLIGVARDLMASKKPADALVILKLDAEQFPKSANVQFFMGEAHAMAEEKDAAVECYKKALELNPEHPFAKKKLEALTTSK